MEMENKDNQQMHVEDAEKQPEPEE